MKRVLLTGATGFVGYPVAQQLLDKGYDLTCVIRPGSHQRLEGLAVETVTTEDLFAESPEWWQRTCAGFDTVIHLAWYAEPGKYLTSERNLDCLSGTLSLARGAAQAGIRRFVGVGTCFEYDLSEGRVSIDTPLAPKTLYAATKAAAGTTLNVFFEQNDIGFLWARLFYLHGPREDPRRLVPYLHSRLAHGENAELSSGVAVKDYMEVRDAARLLIKDILNNREGATNICSGAGISIRALAEQIAEDYGRQDLLQFGARNDDPSDPPVVIGIRSQHDS